jgi:LysR family transcriptional regulator, transcription activator of glutamate synthase operon
MDEDALRAFVVVARHGKVTPAAVELHVSQPTLTRRLQALERELETKLLVRQSSGTRLTSAGERFLEHAVRCLDALHRGRDALDEVAGVLRGSVAVGTIPSVGTYALPDVLARFHRDHPEVRLSLIEGLPRELESILVSGEADLAIVNLPLQRSELTTRTLWREEYVLAIPADHPLASRPLDEGPVPLEEIGREPLVAVPSSPATHAVIAAAEARGAHARLVVSADNHESVRRMVARGVGVALVPRMMTRVSTPHVVYREVGRGVPRRRVAVAHRGEATLSGAARALRDAVVLAFTKKPRRGSGPV